MSQKMLSIRPFIGSKDFEISKNFYRDLGFEEVELGPEMSLFKKQDIGFYLQNYYAKDWVDNTMIFVEVENVAAFWEELVALDITDKYNSARIVPIRHLDWGSECFVHDPSGVLWHFGQFNK